MRLRTSPGGIDRMHTEQLTLYRHVPSTDPGTQDDETLARQACGDPQAFAELYHRFLDRVYRFILIRTGSVQDAQDLTSQTFLAALESIPKYASRGSFGGWLFGIARHKIADHYRRRVDVPLDDVEWLPHPDPDPEEIADARLQLDRVSRALQTLDVQQAEALALRVFGELSASEVGQVMGKTEGAAKMLVHRGLRRLQERLEVTLEVSL
jgi:RNA polymerase sigma-70 factor, ECF subfamily